MRLAVFMVSPNTPNLGSLLPTMPLQRKGRAGRALVQFQQSQAVRHHRQARSTQNTGVEPQFSMLVAQAGAVCAQGKHMVSIKVSHEARQEALKMALHCPWTGVLTVDAITFGS